MSQPKDAQLGYLPTRQEWVPLPIGQNWVSESGGAPFLSPLVPPASVGSSWPFLGKPLEKPPTPNFLLPPLPSTSALLRFAAMPWKTDLQICVFWPVRLSGWGWLMRGTTNRSESSRRERPGYLAPLSPCPAAVWAGLFPHQGHGLQHLLGGLPAPVATAPLPIPLQAWDSN